MPTVVTPTLSSTAGYLVDVRDQVMSLVRFVVMNPGRTSDLWDDKLPSFRTISSTYEGDKDYFAKYLAGQFEQILNNKFRDYLFTCDFTTETYDEKDDDGRYTIHFNIMMDNINGSEDHTGSALISGKISTVKSTNEINLSFERSIDTATI